MYMIIVESIILLLITTCLFLHYILLGVSLNALLLENLICTERGESD